MKKNLTRFLPLLAALVAAAAALILFREALAPGHTLLSPDSQLFRFVDWRDYAFVNLLGGRREIPTFDTPLYWIFPVTVASTVSYALATALLALGVALYLRHWKCPPAAALLGALALAFSGYHFTLFSAGHRGYFIMMAYAVFLLCAVDRLVETGRWPYAVFAAVCAISALRNQPDVFAIWCGVLALYALVRAVVRFRAAPRGARAKLLVRWAAGLAVTAAVAALFGSAAIRYTLTDIVAGREAQIAESARSATDGNEEKPSDEAAAESRWDFATSWSLPPAELPELACPNLRGYDSGNAKGPYWGSLGRNVHYAETGQGFYNFRQHTLYLGAIPLLFALFAALSLLPSSSKTSTTEHTEYTERSPDRIPRAVPRAEDSERNVAQRDSSIKPPSERGVAQSAGGSTADPSPPGEESVVIAFWAVVAIGSLVLALGRYTPAYRLFYSLPMMSGIRGPVKFLHFTEVSVALLAGFGLARLLRGTGRRPALIAGLIGVAAMLLLLAATLWDPAGLDASLTALGVPEASVPAMRTLLVVIRAKTLLLTALFFALGGAALLAPAFCRRALPGWAAWLLAAAVLCDALRATAPYVNPVDARLLVPASNALAESLQKTGQLDGSSWAGNVDPLLSYAPFRHSFEFQGFPYADPCAWQSPDSEPILAARHFRPDDVLRRWQFLGTRLVLVLMEQYNAMQPDTPQFIKLGTYAVTRSGVVAAPAGQAQFGALVLRNWIPNGSIFQRWETAPDAESAWKTLADPGFDLSRKIVVEGTAPDCPRATGLTPIAAKTKTVVGEIEGRRRRIVFETDDKSPEGMLFIRNQFGGLKEIVASVDGAPAEILRANVLYRAVYVPAGHHTVEFRLPLHGGIAAGYGLTALLLLAAAVAVARSH